MATGAIGQKLSLVPLARFSRLQTFTSRCFDALPLRASRRLGVPLLQRRLLREAEIVRGACVPMRVAVRRIVMPRLFKFAYARDDPTCPSTSYPLREKSEMRKDRRSRLWLSELCLGLSAVDSPVDGVGGGLAIRVSCAASHARVPKISPSWD